MYLVSNTVIGDRHRINQILVNLLGNAIKFTPKGYVGVQILYLGMENGICNLRFSVYDTGIGIPDEKKDKIFESFTQASDSISRHYGGSGLGLTIVRELVTMLKGKITVHSPSPFGSVADSKGTCIEMEIPFLIGEAGAIEEKNIVPVLSQPSEQRKGRVLVAEDNPVNQRIAFHMLKKLGFHCELVNNGREALDYLESNSCDLVFMDVHMPVMNGHVATRVIREKLKLTMPIIGLTANVFKEDIDACVTSGMSDHMGKPYTIEQLNIMIHKWISIPASSETEVTGVT